MEIKIQKKALTDGLYLTQSVAERKTTMPILSNVLITVKDKSVLFTATDLEVGLLSYHQAEVIKPGHVAVQAKAFYEIAKELPNDLVTIRTQSNNWVEIKCGKANFKVVGSSAEDFPNLPSSDGASFKMNAAEFIKMVDGVSYAMSNDETRYTLNGVYVEQIDAGNKAKMRLVATDGHRLSYVEKGVTGGFKLPKGVIIPKKGVWEIKKILEGIEDGDFSLQFSDKVVSATANTTTIVCRLIEGQFPPYSQVIPKDNNKVVSVDKALLTQSLRRISLIASEKTKGVKISISPGNLDISSSNPDVGEATDEIPCIYKGETFSVGFNARYFLDILSVLGDEKAVLELKGDTAPCIIRSEFDKGFFSIIMPMRL